ncbi:MAG: pyridoxal-phosphate dependent enzyme [Aggregatilineales bacterium]
MTSPFAPTFEEMLHPHLVDPAVRQRALTALEVDPLDPVNLMNIHWRTPDGGVRHFVLPPVLTGVETPIVVLIGKGFPTGSHKVGPAYSVLIESLLAGEFDPEQHTLVFPSTGNYGIGGAWVSGRMGCKSLVVLPEAMSSERYDLIRHYGAGIITTTGSESNVKEIYDEVNRLRRDEPDMRVLNQFDVMGNYRFHYYVTGNSIVELADELAGKGIGRGKVSAFVSAMGSGGTIAAGDRLKQVWRDHKIVGLEPIQCPTLYANGYGTHDIEGIGDKHVTWIHNVRNMDALMCIDDLACKQGLRVLNDEVGQDVLKSRYDIDHNTAHQMGDLLGISSICNILGAIKTAKYYNMGVDDLIVTVATDAVDRYESVMARMRVDDGAMDSATAVGYIERVFLGVRTDWIMSGTLDVRERWHNLKYFTWVEQQGKSVDALDAQRDPSWWEMEQQRIGEIDAHLSQHRRTMS